MMNLRTADYEVVARRRARLSDGWGWTGVYRAAYSTDKTVVGHKNQFIFIPIACAVGAAGSTIERAAARITERWQIAFGGAGRRLKRPWGGARKGAGRPPATKARCACGKHTLARAIKLRLKCRKEVR